MQTLKRFKSTQFNQLLEYLYNLQRLGIKVGLEHTEQLLAECGNPQTKFRSIHIAGTNGKGSTAAMLFSVLKEAGYKVGLYTSPHLLRFNERIRVNGVPIADTNIVDFVYSYKSAIERIQSTFFETTTALAFSYFAERKVDVAIIETGLGGRLDSTNVLMPEVTVITSITADHTEILGNDLRKIAFEKGGIIKKSTPLILAQQIEKVEKVLLDIAVARNSKVTICKKDALTNFKLTQTGTFFEWENNKFKTTLIGEHQAYNAVLAIEATKVFDKEISGDTIAKGLNNTNWPGRLQLLSATEPVYYDVAHNPNGIKVIINTLAKIFTNKPIGLMALKAEKELAKIAPMLKNNFARLIVTSLPHSGLMEASALQRVLVKYGIHAESETDITKAFQIIRQGTANTVPGIIFGSHYIGKAVFEKFGFSFDNGVI